MKTNRVITFIAVLLILAGAKVRAQEISRLKTQKITLSGNASNVPPRPWILVETQPERIQPVESRPRSPTYNTTDVVDASGAALNAGPVQLVSDEKRTYYIQYPALSVNGDARWLQLEAMVVPRGFGFMQDMGAMKWEQVDRMPDLPLKRLTRGRVSLAINQGSTTVSPREFLVKAVPGHVYAVEIQDDRMDYRMIFRIDSIAANGDCHISWKRL